MSTVIPFPGAEGSIVQKERIASGYVSSSDIFRIVGTGSWRGLFALAGFGGIRVVGRISVRPHHRSKEVFAEWGFDFRQLESRKKDQFNFLLEVSNESECKIIPMSISIGNRRVERSTCPNCGLILNRWSFYCIAGYGWGCTDSCFGLNLDGLEPEQERADAMLRLDIDEREHSIVLPRSYRDSVRIRRIHKTSFFYSRPRLYAMLPGIFQVQSLGRNQTIGHFVADPRMLPVVESKKVEVHDDWSVKP